mmetsp:Transcript_9151/g.19190  ORF Transcript_9151/g.19190 Transcript_9151/m.19190 type:complete len:427 (-) Transcript_9151:151-1431(-)
MFSWFGVFLPAWAPIAGLGTLASALRTPPIAAATPPGRAGRRPFPVSSSSNELSPATDCGTTTPGGTAVAIAEVVGASGRMGTFWLERQPRALGAAGGGGERDPEREGQPQRAPVAVASCPRGGTPGSETPRGCPIYVATPSDAYPEIYEATPPHRRGDLVLVGNAGLLGDDRFGNCTVLVPHFSVLYRNQWKKGGGGGGGEENATQETRYNQKTSIQINTDPLKSPPTYAYGKHSEEAARVLEANGIATSIVPSFREIRAYSGRKLLWASCLWLLCHNHNVEEKSTGRGGPSPLPLAVGEVHEYRREDLEKLVDEILPSLREQLLSPADTSTTEDDNKTSNGDVEKTLAILDRTEVLSYLEAYSKSIANAIPSIDLAKQEYADRNAVWLSSGTTTTRDQPFHAELLERQGVDVGGTGVPPVSGDR